MSIELTYREILIERFIQDKLKAGIVPTPEEIEEEILRLTDDEDLTKPRFSAETYHVASKESASASKFNNTFLTVREDLRVIYRELLLLSGRTVEDYERWNLESTNLEKRLIDLESDIENLLLLTQDTEGFHSFIVDNFSDSSLFDKTLSDAFLDLDSQQVMLGATGNSVTRVLLNNLELDDVSFRIRSTVDFISRADGINTDLRNPFSQTSINWWTIIEMKKAKPVTCELSVRLGPEPIKLSKIFMELHDSSRSSPMIVTPLYSVDNYNFTQLPTNTFTQEIRSRGTFVFEEIEAKYIKFIITKTGPDPGVSDQFSYQFGFKDISFFAEEFGSDESQTFISRPLAVRDTDNNPIQFSKIVLETCERVETNTGIDYFITASNDEDVPINESTQWLPITPINKTTILSQSVLDLGDIVDVEIGDNETLQVSYSGRETDDDYISPAQAFRLLSNSSGTVLDEAISATGIRYTFLNNNDRILNYQIKDINYTGSGTGAKLEIDEDNITLFRNVGTKGLSATGITSKVRDIQKGWGFSDPYYTTTIEILNSEGISMDVGDSPIIIDDVKYSNVISKSILSAGIHTVKVHKDNWLEVEPDLNTLLELESADTLYPFNHKLLIEGYDYGDSFPSVEEQIYAGVDLFAEVQMKKVSIFDLANNLPIDSYKYFALDRDVGETHTGGNDSTRVFVLKVDDANPDFQNERFVLRFKLVNQKYTYIRLKAVLSTEDSKVSPALDSYKIKLGG